MYNVNCADFPFFLPFFFKMQPTIYDARFCIVALTPHRVRFFLFTFASVLRCTDDNIATRGNEANAANYDNACLTLITT